TVHAAAGYYLSRIPDSSLPNRQAMRVIANPLQSLVDHIENFAEDASVGDRTPRTGGRGDLKSHITLRRSYFGDGCRHLTAAPAHGRLTHPTGQNIRPILPSRALFFVHSLVRFWPGFGQKCFT
ncbi:MAG: hypothetical protein J2P49_11380, partial [Methylocapsa sp.]|nr:hypothetical protein [Methylocapsa sp.]